MVDNKLYKDNSIVSITPREFTRMRPGVYCGSTEYSTQLMRELFSNALDEHNIGHGNIITITADTNHGMYTIKDEGQGFPINVPTEEDRTVLEDAFSKLNTSGKYDENGVYGGSALGLNGIGAKLPTYLSTYLMVKSTNSKGQSEKIIFKDGLFESRECLKEPKGKSGTYIEYHPDPQFFDHAEPNKAELVELFTETAALCPNLTIELDWNGEKSVYHSTKGIVDLFDKKVKNKEIISDRFLCKKVDKDNLCEICLTYTSDYTDNIIGYVNYGKTDSGVHYTALKSGLTRVFNTFAQENGLLKKTDNNLTGNELAEGLVVMFNLKANGVQYDSQSKTRVVGIDRTLINSAITNDFASWLNRNKKDGKMIIERALKARKANEAARKAKEAVRAPKEKGLRAKMNISDKFVDCVSKNPSERNLLLVEGLSAGSSAVEARNVKTDCIYMLRGKILSVLKTDDSKVLANQELSDIIKIIGAGYGKTFDINKMEFNKIVITTDADSDGNF